MYVYPTALLAGLLLAFLASDLQNAQAIDKQALQLANSATVAQLVDSSRQPFHRGSGRCQLSWESTLAPV